MESYYSSDEDIAWGPITLREVKRDIKRTMLRKDGRRCTDIGSFVPKLIRQMEFEKEISKAEKTPLHLDVNETATTAEYFTANESLKSESTNSIQKLSKVMDGGMGVPVTIPISDEKDNIHFSPFNTKLTMSPNSVSYIDDINQSVIDYTILSSDEEGETHLLRHFENTSLENAEIGSDQLEIVPQNEEQLDEMRERTDESLHSALKAESFATAEVGLADAESDEEVYVLSSKDPERILSLQKLRLSRELEYSSNDSGNDLDLDENEMDQNSSLGSKSLKYNDTLEEINRILAGDLSSGGSDIEYGSVSIEERSNSCWGSTHKENFQKIDDSEDVQPNVVDDFKIPLKPSRIPRRSPIDKNLLKPLISPKHLTTPPIGVCNKSPITYQKRELPQALHFQNIVSPVRLYINNSPAPFLKHTPKSVVLKDKSTLNSIPETTKINSVYRADLCESLPEVVYKPSTKVVNLNHKTIIPIPASIAKLMVKPVIIKHHKAPAEDYDESLDTTSLSRKLLRGNLTNNSFLDDKNVSVRIHKQGFNI